MALVDEALAPQPPCARAAPGRVARRPPAQCRGYGPRYDPGFLRAMVAPHVESFDFFLTEGLRSIVRHQKPHVFVLPGQSAPVSISVTAVEVGAPQQTVDGAPAPLTPQLCREQSLTYGAPLVCTFEVSQGPRTLALVQPVGQLPVMVASRACVLHGRTPAQLVALREDEREAGGYFISNGAERMVRMLVVPKHGVPQPVRRPAYLRRGAGFTEYGVLFRDRRPDCRAQSVVLHAMRDGGCRVRLLLQRREYFLPLVLVLRALRPATDYQILGAIADGPAETYVAERVELMLREAQRLGCDTRAACLARLGSSFRDVAYRGRPDLSDEQVGAELLEDHLFFSMRDGRDKFALLATMARQLYLLTQGRLRPANQDAAAAHDVLLPGHLFAMFLSEQLQVYKETAAHVVRRHHEQQQFEFTEAFFRRRGVFRQPQLEARFRSLVGVGALHSESGLDLLQQDGFSVAADRLNFVRFMAHFRSVHRGKFFAEMKTTAVRKMLPEGYGYLCPVHTPDGAPCGLLNHIGCWCGVVAADDERDAARVRRAVCGLGVARERGPGAVPVALNGRVLGWLAGGAAAGVARELRRMKVRGELSPHLEVALAAPDNRLGLFPMLSLVTTAGRYTRRVHNLELGRAEWVSPYEQLQLRVAVFDGEAGGATHQELAPISMLSVVAALAPFPDHNQSPRNIYECQMLKQTMGLAARSAGLRVDSRAYRLQAPQRALVKTCVHDVGGFDSHPTGTNAVVAVLSYSGYDMEDACMVSKASLERGLFGGTVYQCEDCDILDELSVSKYSSQQQVPYFRGDGRHPHLDADGLPRPGAVLTAGDALCQYYDPASGAYRTRLYAGRETGVVERVVLTRGPRIRAPTACKVVLRHDRSPTIGDKFASRHGQKGTLSVRYCGRDMPFSHGTGAAPDLVINPHAFPSRMTVGMLLESLGGKLSALCGADTDATPFQHSEERRAADAIGAQLARHGFCRHGSETYYSGVSGEAMPAGVYVGVVYYHRLRHMINDKYQVRATGPVNQVTHQPVKGRKHGGGTRFGEMERDALLAHGAQTLLRGRLCTDSDAAVFRVCAGCGNALNRGRAACALCGAQLRPVVLPAVAGVLAAELAGMGVHMRAALE